MEITVMEVKDSRARIKILDINNDEVFDDTTICEEGAIINFPLTFISMMLSDYMSGVLNTMRVSGVYAPAYETLFENNRFYSWDLIEMAERGVKINPPGIPNTVYLTIYTNIAVHSELATDRESVTVPFGTFPQTIIVLQEVKIPVTMDTASGGIGGDFSMFLTQWYEPYIGLMKMQVDSAGISFAQGINVPIPLEYTIALTEFHSGK
jgi:hypothetical protein